MKNTFIPLSVAFLVGTAALTYSVTAQTALAPTPPAAPSAPGAHTGVRRHPAIRGAIMALERAKAEMQAANHDFGGHREQALLACDAAIAQLRLALQFASQNPPAGQAPQGTP
jgi:hypothetical protein